MITLVAKLQAVEGKASEVRDLLVEMVGNVREKEAGRTLTYSLHVSDSDPHVFVFYEQYADEAAVEEHARSPHFRDIARRLRGLLVGGQVLDRYQQIT